MKQERRRRGYEAEFKREAVKLVQGGLTAAEVGRDLGIRGNLISRWVREASASPQQAFPGNGVMRPEDAELDRLRKEVARLKAERDLLKKATAYFAKEST
jgi:transposase